MAAFNCLFPFTHIFPPHLSPPPLGAAFLSCTLPIVVYALYFVCNAENGDCSPFWLDFEQIANADYFSWRAFGVYVAWVAFQALLYIALPGPVCAVEVNP